MYSMVLMAALTTGTNAPDCFFKHGCHGCHGSWGGYSCHGCYGGYGSCYGCYGGCYGCGGGCYGGWGGCYGCWGGYGAWYGGYGPGAAVIEEKPAGKIKPKSDAKEEMKEDESMVPTKAKLIVDLPTDARLFIDNQPMKTPAGRRVFTTPDLSRGQAYYYILRAEVVRDGKKVARTKRVVIRPGQEVTANFQELNGVEAANAR